jgi:Uma2 family endonuclease
MNTGRKTMTIARPRMTEEEFMRLPDDGRKYELVDGEVKEAPTGVRHDEIAMRIGVLLYPFTRGRGALCSSQAGYRMRGGNIRSPDVSFTLRERLPGGRSPEGFGPFAPDLCIGIISPSEDREEMARKVREYFEAGAQQVWHLYPETQSAVIFTSPLETRPLSAGDQLDGGDLLPGFRCRVADLYALE